MTKQKVPGWWEEGRELVQAGVDEAATHVTCLAYDVDRPPKQADPQVVGSADDDGGINCLLKATQGNADFTVLANLHQPDYQLCAEPFVPFEVVAHQGLNQRLQEVVQQAQHGAVVSPSATTDAVGKGVTKKKQQRVSLQAAFAGSRMVWEGIAAAARARRRPSDLVATPPPVSLAASTKFGDTPAAPPPTTAPAHHADTDSSSCEELGWADGEEEFHRRFHEELNRKLEYERQGHNARSLYVPENKLKKQACLPHWHCSIEHENRKRVGVHPYRCAETLRITSDRMNLGLGLEGYIASAGEGLAVPGASDAIPAGSDTFALVSENLRDDDDSDDSSVSSYSTQHSAPSCKKVGVILRRPAAPADAIPGDKSSARNRRYCPAQRPAREKKPGNMPTSPAQSRRRHPYLKPMLPKGAVIKRRAYQLHSGVPAATEVMSVISPSDMPAPDQLLQTVPAESGVPTLRPLKVARTLASHSTDMGSKVPAASTTLSSKLAQSPAPRLRPSLKAAQKQDPPIREIHITPWNNQSPRPDFLTGSTLANARDSAFCFRISLPGERCLQVKAEAEPNEVHISVSLQEPGLETADKADAVQTPGDRHSTRSPESGVTMKKAFNVSWSCPEILCPSPCAALVESAQGLVTDLSQVSAKNPALRSHIWNLSLRAMNSQDSSAQGCDVREHTSAPEGIQEQVGRGGEHAEQDCVIVLGAKEKRCPTPTRSVPEENAKPQTNKLGHGNLRSLSASLPPDGTGSMAEATCIVETAASEGCAAGEPGRRAKSEKRRDSKLETSPYSGLQEMMEWHRTIAEYKHIKRSQASRTQQDEEKGTTFRFTKSSQKFLDKLSKKSGSGDCLCPKAFKPYSEQGDLEEKENQMLQTCTRGCRLALSTSRPKGTTWNIFSLAPFPKNSDKQQTAVKACRQTEAAPDRTNTDHGSSVVGTKSRAGRKHWLGIFKKAIHEKSQLTQNSGISSHSEQGEQTPRPFSTGNTTY